VATKPLPPQVEFPKHQRFKLATFGGRFEEFENCRRGSEQEHLDERKRGILRDGWGALMGQIPPPLRKLPSRKTKQKPAKTNKTSKKCVKHEKKELFSVQCRNKRIVNVFLGVANVLNVFQVSRTLLMKFASNLSNSTGKIVNQKHGQWKSQLWLVNLAGRGLNGLTSKLLISWMIHGWLELWAKWRPIKRDENGKGGKSKENIRGNL
jgi:hypothetical protein